MPIDFTQIDPEEFELLCEDLLQAMGFTIEAKVGRGPDLGKDIIAAQKVTDPVGFSETHRYLVECKHYAKSGKSVLERDIGSPVARMGTHQCDRYILVTSTVPSEKVCTQLAGMPHTVPHYRAMTWSKGDLARLLDEHPDVRERYFPSEVEEEPTPAGALAERVEGLLTVMGFACQERQAAADRVRLVCTSRGAFARPVAVVCKEGTVERGDLEALLAEVKAQDLGGGVLVTHSRVSPAARERAAETEGAVRAFTLDQFYRELIDLTDRPNFEIVHLLPFDGEDIQTMLRARFPDDWEGYWQRIESTYNLAELAQRPVLLDMMARSLPDLQPGQAINAARLYEIYTDRWLARDEEKGRTLITRTDKRLFMQELALEMLRREQLSLHYSRLPERVRQHFRLEKAHEIDYFEHDIRTCSFLNRDPEGNYRFVHKSFQEFFVAQWLVPELLDGNAPEMGINEEIRGFVHGLLAETMEDWPPPPPPGTKVPEGMVWVPPGPFIMGGEHGFPVQVARIEQGFFAARTPVTNAEFARFVEATGYVTTAEKEGWGYALDREKGIFERTQGADWCHPDGPGSSIEGRMDHPVVQVSWHDAVAYAQWAGARLLTEQEWEKAARGMDGRIYPWGDAFDPARCNTREGGIGTTTPVGRYSPGGDSLCGCVDMAGNVWEWTASGWEPGSESRVLRGGSFIYDGDYARCADRSRYCPSYRYRNCGVRVGVAAAPFSPTSEL